jgi:type VI secretion system protein ImpC
MDSQRYRVLLDVETGRTTAGAERDDDETFRILVMDCFSGATVAPSRGVVAVDRDTIDDVIASLRPSLRFVLGDEGGVEVTAHFESLDDFHPDNLLHRVPLLAALHEVRQQAQAGLLRSGGDTASRAPAATPAVPPGAPPAADPAADPAVADPARVTAAQPPGGSLLDQIVAEARGPGSAAPARQAEIAPTSDLHAFIHAAVAPHRVPDLDQAQVDLVAQVDDTLSSVLRAILHHPAFQALEAAWRGVAFLVRRLETGPRLKVFLLDITRRELDAEFGGDRAAADGTLHSVVARANDDAAPWSVLAGGFTFDGSDGHTRTLARLAALARSAGAPFIAAAAPRLAGVSSFAEQPELEDLRFADGAAWSELRHSADAAFVALALPRFILRAPYHPRDEPCELIVFDEMDAPSSHDDYLWGNPSIAAALLLGEAFSGSGWRMRPGDVLEIGGLPLHLYRHYGETVAKPCAEALLTDRVAVRLLDAGLMPLLSQKNGDAVRFAGFQSVAEPAAPLAGPWHGSR